ncbi:hypothetical protein INR49_007817 [Caranx melampygus]|nr:hypothetical protein INR49_007817 [Caranx melampygus]
MHARSREHGESVNKNTPHGTDQPEEAVFASNEMSEQAADRAHNLHIYDEIRTVRVEHRASLVILTRIIPMAAPFDYE